MQPQTLILNVSPINYDIFMYSLSNNIYISSVEKAFHIDFWDLVAIVNDTISHNFINVQK